MGRKYNTCFIMVQRQFAFILCICIHFTVTHCVSASFYRETNETSSVFPAYILATKADLLPNLTTCRKELEEFRDSVDRRILWALKILDSSGTPTSGFLYGNNFWLGARSQCLDTMNKIPLPISEKFLLNSTLYRDPKKEFPPFPVNYFVAYFKHNGTLQYHVNIPLEDLITLGLCLPLSCTAHDVTIILQEIFHNRGLQIGDLYSMDFRLIKVKTLTDDHHWLVIGAIPIICTVLVLTVVMMMLGTIYDVFVQSYFTVRTVTSDTQNVEEPATSSLRRHYWIRNVGEMLKCFSVYTNTKSLFNTTCDSNSLPVIHGLRFFTMSWIIIVHAIPFSVEFINNKPWASRYTNGFFIQIVSNAIILVDTCLFISGFLLAYLYLKSHAKTNREKRLTYRDKLNEFFGYIIRRFIRLTPAYMMTIGIVQVASSWFKQTSILYSYVKLDETCEKYWWTNLLYINNFYDYSEMCMPWTWYLAVDTQFYIVGVALLILSTVCFYRTIVTLGALIIGSIILSGYVSYVYEYVPTVDELFRLINTIYFPPWFRISPYIIGMLTGIFIIRKNKTLVLKKRTVFLCWCIGSSCNFLVFFGLYERRVSVLFSAAYTALSRTVWAIGIAWVLIACLTENGGIVNKFLSFRSWIPFSRLSYCAYLLNPFIVQAVHLNSETSVHFDFAPEIIVSLGYYVASYICAYALYLMAERPYMLLTRMLFKSLRRREPELRQNGTTDGRLQQTRI